MPYVGVERRNPSLEEIVSDLAVVVRSNGEKVDRLTRLLEGENGTVSINRGVVGALDDLQHTNSKLDKRVSDLEHQWYRYKWVLLGFAAGGGLLGGFGPDLIKKAFGAG